MRAEELLKTGAAVTLISHSTFHYYSGMAPGMLSGRYSDDDCRVDLRRLAKAKGVNFIEGDFEKVDPVNRVVHLSGGATFNYDAVSFNTGSRVPVDLIPGAQRALSVKPFENLSLLKRTIEKSSQAKPLKVVLIGGGPTSVGIAGAIISFANKSKANISLTLLDERERILAAMPKKAASFAAESIVRRGGLIMTNYKVSALREGLIESSNRENVPYDVVVVAIGLVPPRHFKSSGLSCAPDGGMLVNDCMQSVDYPEIFGGGDCISIQNNPLPKVGVYAVRQGPLILKNLKEYLTGGNPIPFKPQRKYLQIINLGDGKAVAVRGRYALGGKLVMILKEVIDKRFMRRFKVD